MFCTKENQSTSFPKLQLKDGINITPRSFQELFLASLPDWLGFKEEGVVSFYMDACPIQDAFRYRARRLGLKVANLSVDETGELNLGQVEKLKKFFNETPYILGPGREGDALIFNHIGHCLKQLEAFWPMIKKFSPPLCHKKAEEIIRDTLWPENIRVIDSVHIRRAVIAAWLTLLRQVTGSCFATAPAILIQQNYPHRFLKDLYDLLTTGQLKRVVAAKEYTVPLNCNLGKGDLQKPMQSAFHCAPGLKAALEAVGISLPRIHDHPQNVEPLIRSILLENIGLTEEELADEEHLARIQMTPLLIKNTAVYYQRPSERAQKAASFKKKFEKACSVFQAFTECALLRCWEFTIASLCDVKTEFARWNLYVGLGMDANSDGIGAFLYAELNDQLQKCNQEIERLSLQYEEILHAVQALEVMFRDATSEARRYQIKAEISVQLQGANSLLEKRNEMAIKSEAIAQFYPSLLLQYDEKLQRAFQELFDPSIGGDGSHFADDSPAGFRLIYKHGRADASQWTAIDSATKYVDTLREFFSAVENEIEAPLSIDRKFISDLTSKVIRWIQEPDFIAAAMRRSQKMGRRSPWDYISGGTMQALLQAYCNRQFPFTESKCVPHSAEELLLFLTKEKKERPILMHSPTHAFIFYPQFLPSDSLAQLKQNREFVTKWNWDEPMQEHIAFRLSERLSEKQSALFLHLFRQRRGVQTKQQFRQALVESLPSDIKNRLEIVDSILFEQMPLFTYPEAKEIVGNIVDNCKLQENSSFFSPFDLHQIMKSALLESAKSPFSSTDWDQKIATSMRNRGWSYPYPILFADTNWSVWLFGFIVNPVSGELELWRLNRIGNQGFPMNDWKEWMSPQNTAPWILLSQSGEYTV